MVTRVFSVKVHPIFVRAQGHIQDNRQHTHTHTHMHTRTHTRAHTHTDLKEGQPLLGEGPDGFGEIPEGFRSCEIQRLAAVVCHNPWHHGILHDVIETAVRETGRGVRVKVESVRHINLQITTLEPWLILDVY